MHKALPWIARAALLFAVLDFGYIGINAILNPASMAANSTLAAAEAAGLTNIRGGFGAFHLAVSIVALFCLATARVGIGLAVVCTFTATAVCVRALGLMIDGSHPRTLLLIQLESLGLLIFVVGFCAHWRSQLRRP